MAIVPMAIVPMAFTIWLALPRLGSAQPFPALHKQPSKVDFPIKQTEKY